jgi:hypothetical protein
MPPSKQDFDQNTAKPSLPSSPSSSSNSTSNPAGPNTSTNPGNLEDYVSAAINNMDDVRKFIRAMKGDDEKQEPGKQDGGKKGEKEKKANGS